MFFFVFRSYLIHPAQADTDFPNRPVKLLVGFAPGGTTDLLARIMADELRSVWNTTVVVENRPGCRRHRRHPALHNASQRRIHTADEHQRPGDYAALEATALRSNPRISSQSLLSGRNIVPYAGDAQIAGENSRKSSSNWQSQLLEGLASRRLAQAARHFWA